MVQRQDGTINVAAWNRAKLRAAETYTDFGWRLAPVVPGTKHPPKGVPWSELRSNRPTASDRQRWFGKSGFGIAVLLGVPSGDLHCCDFDEMEAYLEWAAKHSTLAKTLPTSATGREGGGRQVFFNAADPAQMGGAAYIRLGYGELRGGGSICVLPPSRHRTKRHYQWINRPCGALPRLDMYESGFLNAKPRVALSRFTKAPNLLPRATQDTQDTQDSQDTQAMRACAPGCALSAAEVLKLAEHAIECSLPTEVGERDWLVFKFCRALWSVPELRGADARTLEPALREWHRRALPFIGTRPFEETLCAFIRGLPRVELPLGESLLEHIRDEAAREKPPAIAEQFEQPQLRLLVSICRSFQRWASDNSFYLADRAAGDLVGVHYSTACRWLELLVYCGILKVTSPASKKDRLAKSFRYLGPLS
jgi:Bifunctional DNA primase/polymerase, N-terminal